MATYFQIWGYLSIKYLLEPEAINNLLKLPIIPLNVENRRTFLGGYPGVRKYKFSPVNDSVNCYMWFGLNITILLVKYKFSKIMDILKGCYMWYGEWTVTSQLEENWNLT